MAQLSLFSSLFSWLPRRASDVAPAPSPGTFRPEPMIAWGASVPDAFKLKVIALCRRLDMEPDHLMAIMAFETGRSFDPSVTNRAGSGATGLIQFMPATAKALGTTTARLATMSALEQLDYVEKYLTPYAGRMGDLDSAYMAVLYPRSVDREPDHVLFRKGSVAYKQNRGLDADGDGKVTKSEAAAKVRALLAEGMRPGLIG